MQKVIDLDPSQYRYIPPYRPDPARELEEYFDYHRRNGSYINRRSGPKQPSKPLMDHFFVWLARTFKYTLVCAVIIATAFAWEVRKHQTNTPRQEQEYKESVQLRLDQTRRYHEYCLSKRYPPKSLEYVLGGCVP
jgi:hypothetical protein